MAGYEVIEKISRYFDVSAGYLLGDDPVSADNDLTHILELLKSLPPSSLKMMQTLIEAACEAEGRH